MAGMSERRHDAVFALLADPGRPAAAPGINALRYPALLGDFCRRRALKVNRAVAFPFLD